MRMRNAFCWATCSESHDWGKILDRLMQQDQHCEGVGGRSLFSWTTITSPALVKAKHCKCSLVCGFSSVAESSLALCAAVGQLVMFPVDTSTIIDQKALGSLIVANILVSVVYGITCGQIYIYSKNCHGDKGSLKIAVAILWIFDTLHLMIISHAVYEDVVAKPGDPSILSQVSPTVALHNVAWALSDVLVRAVFAYRLWNFSEHNIRLIYVIGATSFLAFCSMFALGILMLAERDMATIIKASWLGWTAFTFGFCADATIAIALTVLLWNQPMGSPKSNIIYRVLITHSVVTAAATSILACICLSVFKAMPNNLVYLSLSFFPAKLLFMALLLILNAPQYLRRAPGHVSVHFDSLMFSGPDGQLTSTARVATERSDNAKDGPSDFQLYPPRLEVEVETTTTTSVEAQRVLE